MAAGNGRPRWKGRVLEEFERSESPRTDVWPRFNLQAFPSAAALFSADTVAPPLPSSASRLRPRRGPRARLAASANPRWGLRCAGVSLPHRGRCGRPGQPRPATSPPARQKLLSTADPKQHPRRRRHCHRRRRRRHLRRTPSPRESRADSDSIRVRPAPFHPR